ncbi:5' exonuclease Apollo [Dunckerocampus dactyliophorus]|uniref:5' exonuclease Apollo n=1 Tax=Dunckerocampus dactyliophorus TaxID=161453 RepID=UPI002406B9BC|nr:5' exonuclease Apollo [Dunckerocampus dactyliophorus]
MSNGKVIPNTPLAVDFWKVRKCPETRLFFLSHMHSDHTVGLTSTWADRPIYCSPVTASLLRVKLGVKEQWIHPLELGDSYLLPLDDIGKENMTVTLIDANHCPGAVMFLFEGYFGSILYTGDFRYSPSMLRELCLATSATINVLYLDNTNCDPNRIIPTRKQATQQIKEIIRSHPDHNVVLGLYALGKESLLVDLAMEFQTWIEVSYDRMETLKVLELPDVFSTDPGAGRIRVVEQREISFSTLCQWNNEHPTLAIYPTSRPLISFHPKVHVVPYSDHSSHQELMDFVSGLKPSSLVPIIGNGIPGSLSALLPSKRHDEILVPESVRHYMRRLPENNVKSSASSNFHRQHVRPLRPKGVVFDSPVSLAKLGWGVGRLDQESSSEDEEEMDIECVEKHCDSILGDSSKKLTPYKNKREPVVPWSINIVQTIPEEMLMAQSMTLSQLSQSNFAPVKILRNTNACLRPLWSTKETIDDTASNGNHTPPCSYPHVVDSTPLSDDDSISESEGQELDHDTQQDTNHGAKDNNSESLFQSSLDNNPCSSSSFLLEETYTEQLENKILDDLVFTAEDLKVCCLLKKSVVQRFVICPVHKQNVPTSLPK